MNRPALVLLALLALFASAASAAPTSVERDGFIIAIPDGWEIAGRDRFDTSDFVAIEAGSAREFPPRMIVSIDDSGDLANMPTSGYQKLLERRGMTDIVIKVDHVRHGQLRIRRSMHEMTFVGRRLRDYVYFLPRGRAMAAAHFMCTADDGDALLPLFDATIQRFGGLRRPPARPGNGDRVAQLVVLAALLGFLAWFVAQRGGSRS